MKLPKPADATSRFVNRDQPVRKRPALRSLKVLNLKKRAIMNTS
jgi:hypothetical protein